MAIIKQYSHDKKICHVTFILPKEISENFSEVSLVGDFNNWDINKDKFSHKSAEGLFSAEYDLDADKEYQFRYLCDGQIWLNEPEADAQVLTHF
jgi:1,4-alpha-glucan branching enzyme